MVHAQHRAHTLINSLAFLAVIADVGGGKGGGGGGVVLMHCNAFVRTESRLLLR